MELPKFIWPFNEHALLLIFSDVYSGKTINLQLANCQEANYWDAWNYFLQFSFLFSSIWLSKYNLAYAHHPLSFSSDYIIIIFLQYIVLKKTRRKVQNQFLLHFSTSDALLRKAELPAKNALIFTQPQHVYQNSF